MDHNYHSKYLMWMKNMSTVEDAPSNGPAFGGGGGGVAWPPPRSYSCGFCSRQFRSAQALGGHMNVHRRDRARLIKHLHDQEEPAAAPTQLMATTTIHSGYTTSNSSLSWEKEAHDPHLHLCIGLNIIGQGAAVGCKHHNHNAGCSKRAKVISAALDDDDDDDDEDNVVVVPTLPCFLQPCSRSRSRSRPRSRSRSCDHTPGPRRTTNTAYDHLDLELRLATPNYY